MLWREALDGCIAMEATTRQERDDSEGGGGIERDRGRNKGQSGSGGGVEEQVKKGGQRK